MAEGYWWVPDETEVFVIGQKIGEPLANGLIRFTVGGSKQVSANKDQCYPSRVSTANAVPAPDDLVSIPDVNQPSILACTKIRFLRRQIYTDIGAVLMSLNPFERLPNLYGDKVIRQYSNPFTAGLSPHVYMIPSRAFQTMKDTGRNQSILISGESGAGEY